MHYGCDVSFHKGFPDWSKAKEKISFAILGVTERYGKDASFEHNYKGCAANGIPVGAYKYSYARDGAESREEALELVKVLEGRPLQMPVYLDLEWDAQKMRDERTLRDIIEKFRETIEEYGYVFGGIYCNLDWYRNYLPTYARDKYKLWLASYPYNDTGEVVEGVKPIVSNMIGWQYTDRGKVPGFDGDVDLDIWYEEIPDAPFDLSTVSAVRPTLAIGSTGNSVRTLQSLLNHAGAHLDVDSQFGPLTRAAVIDYQDSHGLDPDGIVGPLTWDALTQGITDESLAREVLAGMWGTGTDRKTRLEEIGADYDAVQSIVNKMLEGNG